MKSKAIAAHGISFAAPQIDLDKLRSYKEKVVGKKLTGGLAGMAKARKVTVLHGIGTLPRSASPGSRDRKNGGDRQGGAIRRGDHRRRLAGHQAAVHARRPARRGFDRRARAAADPEIHARDRRRHHRARDGDGLFLARHAHRRGRDARRLDDGRRPRPRQGVGEEERAALRQRHVEDEDGGGRGDTRRHRGAASRARRRRPSRRSTTWSWWRSGAVRTARTSARTKPAWP